MKRTSYNLSVGAWIRRQRLALGVSQADLADAVHVSASSVSAWERGAGGLSAYAHAALRAFFKARWAEREVAGASGGQAASDGSEAAEATS